MMHGRGLRVGTLALALLSLVPAAGGAATEVGLERVAGGLGPLAAVVSAGDERLFLVELAGRIRVWDGQQVLPQPFLDISDQVLAGGERGLFSVAFHPRYAENRRFFVHYTDQRGDTVLARLLVSADPDRAEPDSEVVLLNLAQPFANHNGGQLAFGPDGYLYLGLGDGGAGGDPLCHAQRADSLLGKILRLDVDAHDQSAPFYGIPPDNPFRGPGGFADEVWDLGLRNPWRFSFDRTSGDLFIADVGQGTREEVDFEPAGSGGRNYGWNSEEGSLCFAGGASCPGAPPCGDPALVRPIVEYGHGGGDCSVTGGYVYRGQRFPDLAGAYFYGDFCSGRLWLARRAGGGWREELLEPRLPQLTSFGEDRDGELYLTTLGGELYRLLGPEEPPPADRPGSYEQRIDRFRLASADGQPAVVVRLVSPAGLALAGDWLGEGSARPGVYDQETGRFHLDTDLRSGPPELAFRFGPGQSGWRPVAGDWDGRGGDGVGLFEAANLIFRLRNALADGPTELTVTLARGPGNWLPLAGDWDGDGRDEVGVFRPGDGRVRLKRCLRAGCAELAFRFRPAPGRRLLPLAGDWDGDGRDGVGAYDPATATFYLRNATSTGPADLVVKLGPPNAQPVAGNW